MTSYCTMEKDEVSNRRIQHRNYQHDNLCVALCFNITVNAKDLKFYESESPGPDRQDWCVFISIIQCDGLWNGTFGMDGC